MEKDIDLTTIAHIFADFIETADKQESAPDGEEA